MMKGIIRYIKSLFGKYESGYEYWVYTKDIKVPNSYKLTKIGTKKWNHKMGYWLRTGEFESDILIDRDFNLIDGYSSMKIAHLKGIEKVPVYFVDQNRNFIGYLIISTFIGVNATKLIYKTNKTY